MRGPLLSAGPTSRCAERVLPSEVNTASKSELFPSTPGLMLGGGSRFRARLYGTPRGLPGPLAHSGVLRTAAAVVGGPPMLPTCTSTPICTWECSSLRTHTPAAQIWMAAGPRARRGWDVGVWPMSAPATYLVPTRTPRQPAARISSFPRFRVCNQHESSTREDVMRLREWIPGGGMSAQVGSCLFPEQVTGKVGPDRGLEHSLRQST